MNVMALEQVRNQCRKTVMMKMNGILVPATDRNMYGEIMRKCNQLLETIENQRRIIDSACLCAESISNRELLESFAILRNTQINQEEELLREIYNFCYQIVCM